MYFCVPLSPHLFAGQKSGSRIGPVPAMCLRAPPAFCSAKMPRLFYSEKKVYFQTGKIAAGHRLGPQAKPPSGRLSRAKPAAGVGGFGGRRPRRRCCASPGLRPLPIPQALPRKYPHLTDPCKPIQHKVSAARKSPSPYRGGASDYGFSPIHWAAGGWDYR